MTTEAFDWDDPRAGFAPRLRPGQIVVLGTSRARVERPAHWGSAGAQLNVLFLHHADFVPGEELQLKAILGGWALARRKRSRRRCGWPLRRLPPPMPLLGMPMPDTLYLLNLSESCSSAWCCLNTGSNTYRWLSASLAVSLTLQRHTIDVRWGPIVGTVCRAAPGSL